MTEIHKAYRKYIELLKMIPDKPLKNQLKRQEILRNKAENQVSLIQEELNRRKPKNEIYCNVPKLEDSITIEEIEDQIQEGKKLEDIICDMLELGYNMRLFK
jgi:hypothetical protein